MGQAPGRPGGKPEFYPVPRIRRHAIAALRAGRAIRRTYILFRKMQAGSGSTHDTSCPMSLRSPHDMPMTVHRPHPGTAE